MRLVIKKCIFGVNKGTPYHYWKVVKELRKVGLYVIEEINRCEGNDFSTGNVFMMDKKEINFFDDLMDVIQQETKSKLRDWKINQII